ncbi:MAG: hypothetical protein IT384_27885 [Deltaproteobacteria bacterium]|nr:hypothetical protein [Deltaproteobacteria bacterium]
MNPIQFPRFLVVFGAFAGLASGCGAETGNGIAGIRMALTQGDEPPVQGMTLQTTDLAGTRFTIERSRAYITSIELMLPGEKICEDEDFAQSGFVVHCDSAKIRIEGPIIVNLMDGSSTPSLVNLKVPPAIYKRVDVRLAPGDPKKGVVMAGDSLDDRTFEAGGSFSYQQMTPTFDLSLRFDEDARFEDPAGVEVTAEAQELLLLLDVAQWFNTLPITGCIQSGDLTITNGHLQIADKGAGQCSAIENALKERLKNGTKLKKK